jgi:hypothetical protein
MDSITETEGLTTETKIKITTEIEMTETMSLVNKKNDQKGKKDPRAASLVVKRVTRELSALKSLHQNKMSKDLTKSLNRLRK